MHLFADYVHPLTEWLRTNPHWSLFITFTISLAESLAIIGTIVPGSVTMTAIGILAGSGVMRIDLTLLAATLGAIAGDSLSYLLGYIYSDKIAYMWPFKQYPHWLTYGKDFFERHGGKSVLIGRFVGPIRSIIPVIAGIMHMEHWRFFLANALSAIGWSIVYIIPGVLIGAASTELSTENATRLFILILVLLVAAWIFSILIKWTLSKINLYINPFLHRYWMSLKSNPKFQWLYNGLTPDHEKNHFLTAKLFFLCLANLLFLIIIALLSLTHQLVQPINLPIHLLLQSFRSHPLDFIFIFFLQLTSIQTIAVTFIFTVCIFLYTKHTKLIFYITSLVITCSLLTLFLHSLAFYPRPPGLQTPLSSSSFPVFTLAIATAFYGFMVYYINHHYMHLTNTLRTFILLVLSFSGFSYMYMGDYWLLDIIASFAIGTFVLLVHWMLYRKYNQRRTTKISSLAFLLPICVLLGTSVVCSTIRFNSVSKSHQLDHHLEKMFFATWWEQHTLLLPLYRHNRVGKKVSLFNIQYYGQLQTLEDSLRKDGWVEQVDTFLNNIFMRINQSTKVKLPLLSQLYHNKSPKLVMTYYNIKTNTKLVLRLWDSDILLSPKNNPLWIGSIHPERHFKPIKNKQQESNPLKILNKSLTQFNTRQILIPVSELSKSTIPVAPYILLIKQQHD